MAGDLQNGGPSLAEKELVDLWLPEVPLTWTLTYYW